MITTHCGSEQPYFETSNHPLSHQLGSEFVSNENAQWSALVNRAVWSEQISERYEPTDQLVSSRFLAVLDHSAMVSLACNMIIIEISSLGASMSYYKLPGDIPDGIASTSQHEERQVECLHELHTLRMT